MTSVKAKKSEGAIVVTAQQSRFHETDSVSRDIDINNLSITIGGQRQILQNARLVLKSGLRYVFAGRNGLGKSTVLKALAERKMPGIHPSLRILLLDQSLVEERANELSTEPNSHSVTVLQHVVSSDKLRKRLLHDASRLSTAMQDDAAGSGILSTTYRKLKLEEAQRTFVEAQLVAQHRSGARGAKARQVLNAKESEVREAEAQLEKAGPETAIDDLEAATALLENLQLELDAIGSSTVEARARTTLIGLGFSAEQIDGPMTELSGGWQTRAALAAALVTASDILLLDEPTNFLDLPAIIWLQHYLTTSLDPGTTLVVTTHDRDFADAVAERLLILRINPALTLETFNGTLSDYFAETRRQIRRMTKMSAALEKKKAHMESTVQSSIAAAKRTGDDKKLKQAASRKKKLEERTGLEVSAKGTRFKLNRDLPGFHTKNRADIDIPDLDPPVTMAIPSEPPELRNSNTLASLEHVTFTYKKAKRPTLGDISLTIQPGSRTGLVGLNGSGKSTLLRLIDSSSATEAASLGKTAGVITHHSQARVARYNQHATTLLLQKGLAEPALTPLSYLSQLYPSIAEQPLRALLSGLALPPAAQAHTPLAALSGGQLVRVALAECLLPTPPQLLILDEVTTHLDADSIVALIQTLKHYTGALLVVSHDRFFMRCVVEGMSVKQASTTDDADNEDEPESSSDEEEGKVSGKVFRLTRTSGKMIHLERGMDEYEEIVTRQLAKQGIHI